jgi:WYL domain-containing protein
MTRPGDFARTTRRVTVERIHGRTDTEPEHVVGFCHLRQDERRFRVDRIRELTVPSEGRVCSPAWYFRRRIASARGERPTIRKTESILLAERVGAHVVIAWQRSAESARDGKARVELYDLQVDTITQHWLGLRLHGEAQRRASDGVRAWRGEKTFYLRDCVELRMPNGTLIDQPDVYLYRLAGLAETERPVILKS